MVLYTDPEYVSCHSPYSGKLQQPLGFDIAFPMSLIFWSLIKQISVSCVLQVLSMLSLWLDCRQLASQGQWELIQLSLCPKLGYI